MNKTLFSFTALVSMAFASDLTVYSGEVNATKPDLNLTANILRTKTCDAIEKIGKVEDGKLKINVVEVSLFGKRLQEISGGNIKEKGIVLLLQKITNSANIEGVAYILLIA